MHVTNGVLQMAWRPWFPSLFGKLELYGVEQNPTYVRPVSIVVAGDTAADKLNIDGKEGV